MSRIKLPPWLIAVLVFGLIALKIPYFCSILVNNHLQIVLTRIGLAASTISQCAPDTLSFSNSEELTLALDRNRTLLSTTWSTNRLQMNMIRAYAWSGQEARALELLQEVTFASHVDPILDLLRWDINQGIEDQQGLGSAEPWAWDYGIFLKRALCWLDAGVQDEAILETGYYLQGETRQWSSEQVRDIIALYLDLKQQCPNAALCAEQLRALRTQLVAYLKQASSSERQETRAASHFYLGRLLVQEGNTEEALENYREAAQLEPTNLSYRVHLGAWLNSAGLYAESEKELMMARSLAVTRSDQAWILGQLGYLYLNQDRYQEAASLFQQSIQADISDVSYQIGLGQAYWKMGEPKKAVEILSRVIEIAPDNALAKQLLKTWE